VSRKASKLSRYETSERYQQTARMRTALQFLFGTYLCGSVPVQKGLAELLLPDWAQWARCQGSRVTGCGEVAGQLYQTGWRVGLVVARISDLWMKRRVIPCVRSLGGLIRLLLLAIRVLGAVTSGKGFSSPTGEFPRRPCLALPLCRAGKVTSGYNTWWKCQGDAAVGRRPPRPPPFQGIQQIRSSPGFPFQGRSR
jgi:hypothetical protein